MKQNFAGALVDICNSFGNKIAVQDHATSLTYQELGRKIISVAGFLNDHGIRSEQRVLIKLDNCIEWPAIFFGCVYIGAIPVVISPHYQSHDFDSIVSLIDPTFIIDSTNLSEVWSNQSSTSVVLKHLNSLAFITMTSGSTAHFKAVMHAHNRFYNFVNLEANNYYNLAPSSTVLAIPKFYFAWGISVGVICPLFCGATVIIGDTTKLGHLVESLNNATHVFCVPTVARLIVSKMSKPVANPLRLFLAGEMPSESLVNKIVRYFNSLPVISIGMTEVGSYCGNSVKCPTPTTLGNYLFEGKIKIVNEQGQECDVNEVGEIYVLSKNPTMGYWLDPSATHQTYIGPWIRTRDVGLINTQGNLEVCGRVGDCFKINGIMYYASDIEKEILSIPGVDDCAVLVVPDERRDYMPSVLVYVCTKENFNIVQKNIVQQITVINLKENQIELVDTIPQTITQKKAKYKLLEKGPIDEKIAFNLNVCLPN